MNILKRLFTPTPLAIVNDELEAARLQLLSAENDLEHVQAQVNLLNTRIARLESKLKTAATYSSLRDPQFYATRLHSATPESVTRSQQNEQDISELRPMISGTANIAA